MEKRIRNLFCLLMGLLGFKSLTAQAEDLFLCSDTFPGESQDATYKDCIDLLSWSWGMSNSSTTHTGGGGGGAGVASVNDLSVVKYVDKSSPDLMLHTANGKVFPKVELFMRGNCPDACTQPYYKLKMENVLVSSISTGGSEDTGRPTESVSFNFSKVEWCYTPLLKDSTPGTEICRAWDIAANQEP